mmetsp:Transcript_17479/g.25840  ORF Transcript_17479/g.25840 Transcript_17479/m.25840 type:complete len:186 (-) Transcript_17479:281-838(-)
MSESSASSVCSSSSYSSSDDDSSIADDAKKDVTDENKEEMLQIRQRAFDLLGGGQPGKEEEKWPESPTKVISYQSYQQQQAGGESSESDSRIHRQQHRQEGVHRHHNPARVAEKLSASELFVNCISTVFQTSASFVSNGYQSVSTRYHHVDESPSLSGVYGTIDTSQHGYGKNNSHGGMVGRYQD